MAMMMAVEGGVQHQEGEGVRKGPDQRVNMLLSAKRQPTWRQEAKIRLQEPVGIPTCLS